MNATLSKAPSQKDYSSLPAELVALVEDYRGQKMEIMSLEFLSENPHLVSLIEKVFRGYLRADGTERDALLMNQITEIIRLHCRAIGIQVNPRLSLPDLLNAFSESHPDACCLIREAIDHYCDGLSTDYQSLIDSHKENSSLWV